MHTAREPVGAGEPTGEPAWLAGGDRAAERVGDPLSDIAEVDVVQPTTDPAKGVRAEPNLRWVARHHLPSPRDKWTQCGAVRHRARQHQARWGHRTIAGED